jgi:hypothetical protein
MDSWLPAALIVVVFIATHAEFRNIRRALRAFRRR